MTDSELNEKVAAKLGWKREVVELIDDPVVGDPSNKAAVYSQPPDYANDIGAAAGILNRLYPILTRIETQEIKDETFWKCTFSRNGITISIVSSSIPRAICEAFLKLEDL